MEDLEKVRKNGFELKHVKEQTPEICLEAIKQNACAVYYIKIPIDINDIVNALLHHKKDVSNYIYAINTENIKNIKIAYQKALMQRELTKGKKPKSLLGALNIDLIKKGWYTKHTGRILKASKDNITMSIKDGEMICFEGLAQHEYIEMITYSIKCYDKYSIQYSISKTTWGTMLADPNFDPTKPWEQFKNIGTEIFEKIET